MYSKYKTSCIPFTTNDAYNIQSCNTDIVSKISLTLLTITIKIGVELVQFTKWVIDS